FQRVAVAHPAALPSRCCCEKPAPSARRVVAGRLATAPSSTETRGHATTPNSRPRSTGADAIPNPTAGPAPTPNVGLGPGVSGRPAAAATVGPSGGDGVATGCVGLAVGGSGGDAA